MRAEGLRLTAVFVGFALDAHRNGVSALQIPAGGHALAGNQSPAQRVKSEHTFRDVALLAMKQEEKDEAKQRVNGTAERTQPQTDENGEEIRHEGVGANVRPGNATESVADLEASPTPSSHTTSANEEKGEESISATPSPAPSVRTEDEKHDVGSNLSNQEVRPEDATSRPANEDAAQEAKKRNAASELGEQPGEETTTNIEADHSGKRNVKSSTEREKEEAAGSKKGLEAEHIEDEAVEVGASDSTGKRGILERPGLRKSTEGDENNEEGEESEKNTETNKKDDAEVEKKEATGTDSAEKRSFLERLGLRKNTNDGEAKGDLKSSGEIKREHTPEGGAGVNHALAAAAAAPLLTAGVYGAAAGAPDLSSVTPYGAVALPPAMPSAMTSKDLYGPPSVSPYGGFGGAAPIAANPYGSASLHRAGIHGNYASQYGATGAAGAAGAVALGGVAAYGALATGSGIPPAAVNLEYEQNLRKYGEVTPPKTVLQSEEVKDTYNAPVYEIQLETEELARENLQSPPTSLREEHGGLTSTQPGLTRQEADTRLLKNEIDPVRAQEKKVEAQNKQARQIAAHETTRDALVAELTESMDKDCNNCPVAK